NRGDVGFVLGPLISVQALATQPIFAAAGMAQIFFGSAEEFTQQHESAPLSLRYSVQTSIEMAPVAKYAVEVNQQKNFFVLAQNSDVGRSYAAALRAALKQVGGRFVADPEFYPAFNRDFATLMTKVKNSGADALLMGTGLPVEILGALDAYERQGLTPDQVGFYGNITLTNENFFQQAGITGRADGFIFPWIFDDGTDPRDFPRTKPAEQAIMMTQAFIQRFGHPPTSETELPAWGWGGLHLISAAITGLIAEQGADRLAGMKPVGELPRAAIGYLLEGAAPDRPGRTLQTTFGDLGFFSCGQADILVGAATYKHGTRWLLRDRKWAQALVPPLC
ncbi:MAG TPA: amino acid ABC transporter substrate-binding protein, partial [Candidatus Fraserbacteria bacterium]|nr:amino acid ABC transporter substrate-binding protein [Candidatus Fraserbacteria bacterium]